MKKREGAVRLLALILQVQDLATCLGCYNTGSVRSTEGVVFDHSWPKFALARA